MFLSHAVLTNKPGVQSIFAGGPLPVPSSPPSAPCRPLSACGYPPRPLTIPPTQYSPTSPAYSPTSPAVRCQRQDIPFRPLPPTARAALETLTAHDPGGPRSPASPTQYSPTSPAYSPTSFDGAGQASSSPSSFGADSTPSSGAGGQTPAGAYSPSQAAYEPSAPPPDEKEPKKEG